MDLILFNAFLGSQEVRENIMAGLSSLSHIHTYTYTSCTHIHNLELRTVIFKKNVKSGFSERQ